jgi:lysozyme
MAGMGVSQDPELLARVKQFEGYRRHAYRCSLGHLTIGYGTMIEEGGHGVPSYIAELLLRDYLQTIETRLKVHEWYGELNAPRQHCILEMAYQMGVEGVLGFEKMIEALKRGDWPAAEAEALDSLWAKQTPARARDVAERLKLG